MIVISINGNIWRYYFKFLHHFLLPLRRDHGLAGCFCELVALQLCRNVGVERLVGVVRHAVDFNQGKTQLRLGVCVLEVMYTLSRLGVLFVRRNNVQMYSRGSPFRAILAKIFGLQQR